MQKTETSFEIKKAKIRGEVSEGMICAEDELGLSDDHAGIMVLDETKLKLENHWPIILN
jgi:phenylalanyl-tRNA synthetase beta chain